MAATANFPSDQVMVMVTVRLPVEWTASPATVGAPPLCVGDAEPSDSPRDRPSSRPWGPDIASSRLIVPALSGNAGAEGRQKV